jgi:hypothetical protein
VLEYWRQSGVGMASSPCRVEREYQQEYNRRRYLPAQLAATERKLELLRKEARRLGMDELLDLARQA